jgi:hypothetical protein
MGWIEVLLGVLALMLFLVLGIAGAVMVMVSRMTRRGIHLTPALEQELPRDYAAMREVAAWAETQGFEHVGCYIAHLLSPSFLAAWRHRERPTYLCLYGVQGAYHHEFVTLFEGGHLLTTASTPDSQLLPHPDGYYVQSFNGLSLDELLTRHAAAEYFLLHEGRLQQAPIARTFEDDISLALARQLAYIRHIPLWWLRGGYWFLVRKDSLHGKTLEQLHRARKAPLPHEPRFKEFVMK